MTVILIVLVVFPPFAGLDRLPPGLHLHLVTPHLPGYLLTVLIITLGACITVVLVTLTLLAVPDPRQPGQSVLHLPPGPGGPPSQPSLHLLVLLLQTHLLD